ncbi:LacI family DNA-binding transcriptional regulator [Streptomyces sp. NPDC090088]|uniref:LacI family DNA-binding transcriptional regulator n=1 Tax=Streptomyces sp. NPDC090088 TaxID=3365944 RepID=UPI00380FC7DC
MPKSPGTANKPSTIHEVARLTGVSHQTMSRHLRQDPGMQPATLAKIARPCLPEQTRRLTGHPKPGDPAPTRSRPRNRAQAAQKGAARHPQGG